MEWHNQINVEKINSANFENKPNPGEGNGNPLQHSCLGNPMDRGAQWATVHGVPKEWDTN